MAAPRAADIMARVTTNGGMRTLPTKKPFTNPASVPTPTPARIPTRVPCDLIIEAATTLTRAATDPTERSMPAVNITMV